MFPVWNRTLIAISVSFHSVAILSTLFRLWYRWYTALMWWDDGWAVLTLLADIALLVAAIIEQPIAHAAIPRRFTLGNWIISFAYPIVMWATRISILISMMRVSRPEGMLRRISLNTGVLFGIFGVTMFALRVYLCIEMQCLMTRPVLLTQATVDCFADALLSALPVLLLYKMNLSRKRKILVISTLSASMVINVVTIMEIVAFYRSATSGSIIFGHVKVACSTMVCNLLVIVTFIHRILHKKNPGLEDSTDSTEAVELTTVFLALGSMLSQEETNKAAVHVVRDIANVDSQE